MGKESHLKWNRGKGSLQEQERKKRRVLWLNQVAGLSKSWLFLLYSLPPTKAKISPVTGFAYRRSLWLGIPFSVRLPGISA